MDTCHFMLPDSVFTTQECMQFLSLLLRYHICRLETTPKSQYPKAIGRTNSHNTSPFLFNTVQS